MLNLFLLVCSWFLIGALSFLCARFIRSETMGVVLTFWGLIALAMMSFQVIAMYGHL